MTQSEQAREIILEHVVGVLRGVTMSEGEAVTEATNAEEAGRIAGFRKGDMADAAERLVEGKGWLPPLLRTAPIAAEAAAPGETGQDGGDDDYVFAAE
ncbi:hypothetical protein LTR94_024322 [Friedmanniomyces endolithicus]|nr:hypothetical protein LTR94_024322 [Friedmanniomyces endolithicus]